MTSVRPERFDPERSFDDLLPLLRVLDDESGLDQVFARDLERRLMQQHAQCAARQPVDGPTLQPSVPHGARPTITTRAPGRSRQGSATGFLLAAVLVLVTLAGIAAALRLVVPERPGRTLPAPGIVAGRAGSATPSVVEPGTAMERGNPGRTGEVGGSGPVENPVVRWRVPILEGHYFSPRAMVATDELVVAAGWGTSSGDVEGTQAGYAVAFDAESGEERWRFRSAGPEEATDLSAPVVSGGTAYLGVSNYRMVEITVPDCLLPPCDDESVPPIPDRHETGYVVALDAETGAERWRAPTTVAVPVSPVVSRGTLYVGTGGGGLLALDANSGQRRWQWEPDLGGEDGEEGWVGVPAASNDIVYVTAGDSHLEDVALYALDARTGQEQWSTAPRGVTFFDPVVYEGMLFVRASIRTLGTSEGGEGSSDRAPSQPAFFALDATTGAELWRHEAGGDAVVAGGSVFLAEEQGNQTTVLALDATTGRERWRAAGTGSDGWWPTLAYADGVLYQDLWWDPQSLPELLRSAADLVGIDPEGGLRALDAATGAELWRFEAESEGGITTAIGNGAAYLLESGESGFLTALKDGR